MFNGAFFFIVEMIDVPQINQIENHFMKRIKKAITIVQKATNADNRLWK